jgi:hypothetical protein
MRWRNVGRKTKQGSRFHDQSASEVYVQQIGPEQDRFFDFWESEIAPEFAA